MYSINVSGYIPAKKAKEFKQHMIQLVGQQSSELIRFSVFHNMMIEDLYQVEVQFQDKESMFSFLRSEEYAIIIL